MTLTISFSSSSSSSFHFSPLFLLPRPPPPSPPPPVTWACISNCSYGSTICFPSSKQKWKEPCTHTIQPRRADGSNILYFSGFWPAGMICTSLQYQRLEVQATPRANGSRGKGWRPMGDIPLSPSHSAQRRKRPSRYTCVFGQSNPTITFCVASMLILMGRGC